MISINTSNSLSSSTSSLDSLTPLPNKLQSWIEKRQRTYIPPFPPSSSNSRIEHLVSLVNTPEFRNLRQAYKGLELMYPSVFKAAGIRMDSSLQSYETLGNVDPNQIAVVKIPPNFPTEEIALSARVEAGIICCARGLDISGNLYLGLCHMTADFTADDSFTGLIKRLHNSGCDTRTITLYLVGGRINTPLDPGTIDFEIKCLSSKYIKRIKAVRLHLNQNFSETTPIKKENFKIDSVKTPSPVELAPISSSSTTSSSSAQKKQYHVLLKVNEIIYSFNTIQPEKTKELDRHYNGYECSAVHSFVYEQPIKKEIQIIKKLNILALTDSIRAIATLKGIAPSHGLPDLQISFSEQPEAPEEPPSAKRVKLTQDLKEDLNREKGSG